MREDLSLIKEPESGHRPGRCVHYLPNLNSRKKRYVAEQFPRSEVQLSFADVPERPTENYLLAKIFFSMVVA